MTNQEGANAITNEKLKSFISSKTNEKYKEDLASLKKKLEENEDDMILMKVESNYVKGRWNRLTDERDAL